MNLTNQVSAKEKLGQKEIKKDSAKVYRDFNEMKRQLEVVTTKYEKLRKSEYRVKISPKQVLKEPLSPASKIDNLFVQSKGKITKAVREKLILGEILMNQFETETTNNSHDFKRTKADIVCNDYLRKYRVMKKGKNFVNYRYMKTYESCGTVLLKKGNFKFKKKRRSIGIFTAR